MTQPMNPVDYVPSKAVQLIMGMIIESRYQETSSWQDASEKRFQDGARWQLNVTMRALVRLEANIIDPDDLDELCADLIDDTVINMC